MSQRKPARRKPSAYQRIMRAAKAGVGVRLSADEVWAMSHDNAIETVALNDDEDDAARRERGTDRTDRGER